MTQQIRSHDMADAENMETPPRQRLKTPDPSVQNPSAQTQDLRVEDPSAQTSDCSIENPSAQTQDFRVEDPSAQTSDCSVENPSAQTQDPSVQNPSAQTQDPSVENPSAQTQDHRVEDPSAQTPDCSVQNPSAQTQDPSVQNPSAQTQDCSVENPSAQTQDPRVEDPSAQTSDCIVLNPSDQTQDPSVENPSAQTPDPSVETPSAQTPDPSVETPSAQTQDPSVETPNAQTQDPSVENLSAQTQDPSVENPNLGHCSQGAVPHGFLTPFRSSLRPVMWTCPQSLKCPSWTCLTVVSSGLLMAAESSLPASLCPHFLCAKPTSRSRATVGLPRSEHGSVGGWAVLHVSCCLLELFSAAVASCLLTEAPNLQLWKTSLKLDLCKTSLKLDLCKTSPILDLCKSSPNLDLCKTSPILDLCKTAPILDLWKTSLNLDLCKTSPILDLWKTSVNLDLCKTSPNLDLCKTAPILDLWKTSLNLDLCKTSPILDLWKTSVNLDLCKTSLNLDLWKTAPNLDLWKTSPNLDLWKTAPILDLWKTAPILDLWKTAPILDLWKTSLNLDLFRTPLKFGAVFQRFSGLGLEIFYRVTVKFSVNLGGKSSQLSDIVSLLKETAAFLSQYALSMLKRPRGTYVTHVCYIERGVIVRQVFVLLPSSRYTKANALSCQFSLEVQTHVPGAQDAFLLCDLDHTVTRVNPHPLQCHPHHLGNTSLGMGRPELRGTGRLALAQRWWPLVRRDMVSHIALHAVCATHSSCGQTTTTPSFGETGVTDLSTAAPPTRGSSVQSAGGCFLSGAGTCRGFGRVMEAKWRESIGSWANFCSSTAKLTHLPAAPTCLGQNTPRTPCAMHPLVPPPLSAFWVPNPHCTLKQPILPPPTCFAENQNA
ncbi:hypothetical protein P4O66_001839 [Electrophorus voltai]|uniref:Uncharacterized protein n=1 Tax=Electrophorus voltai TaxID=2609070 RepID=A0AAD8Z410_9TELE|nr:hypothetical protein P4O66_001839 [Electrophorus voltai]